MSTVANRMRASGSHGSSGGGSTARITSGSVSHTTVTAVDQIFAVVASTSRLRWARGRVVRSGRSWVLPSSPVHQALMTWSRSNALHVESVG